MAFLQGSFWREIAKIRQGHAERIKQQTAVGPMGAFDGEVVHNEPHVADSRVFSANRADVLGDGDISIGLACDYATLVGGANLKRPVAVLSADRL